MNYCGECGERVGADDRFCGSCGTLTDHANATDPTPLVMLRPDHEPPSRPAVPTAVTTLTPLTPLTPASVFGGEPVASDPSTDPTVPTPRLPPSNAVSNAEPGAVPGAVPGAMPGVADPTVPVAIGVAQSADGADAHSLFDPAPAVAAAHPPVAPSNDDSVAPGAGEEWLRPARRSWSPALVIGFIALVLLAAGATVLLLDRGDESSGTGAPAATTIAVTTPTTELGNTTTSAPQSTTAAASTTTIVLTPEQQLAALQSTDHAAVEEFVGRWVPQLSGKKVGTVDDGITYDIAAVLEFHETLRAQYGALLLYSGDYTYQTTDLWVSVAPVSFPTANGAIQWCVAEDIGRDDCFAKLITHDPAITDTVQMQP